MLIAALKDTKSYHDDMKENLHFKTNKTKNKKEHIRLVIVFIGVDMIATIDDEVYVLNILKIYSYFSFVFSIVSKKVELLKIPKVT